MVGNAQQNRRGQLSRAATLSAIVGPLLVQITAGFLARLQDLFCPANFLPLYVVSFILLAPGFYSMGWAGADAALRLSNRGAPRWVTLLALAVGGGVVGFLYFEALAVLIRWTLSDYAVLLRMPGLRAAVCMGGAIVANGSILFRASELQALSLR